MKMTTLMTMHVRKKTYPPYFTYSGYTVGSLATEYENDITREVKAFEIYTLLVVNINANKEVLYYTGCIVGLPVIS